MKLNIITDKLSHRPYDNIKSICNIFCTNFAEKKKKLEYQII